jgi:hypothetical protein
MFRSKSLLSNNGHHWGQKEGRDARKRPGGIKNVLHFDLHGIHMDGYLK